MAKILLVTPPFTQINSPYPATAYLKGYLGSRGYEAEQFDLSTELINGVFSLGFLERVFGLFKGSRDENIVRIYAMRREYLRSVDAVMDFLRGTNPELAVLICSGEFLPQASRFAAAEDTDYFFGTLGSLDCAKFLCTLYLQDLSDFIRDTVSAHFEIVRYGEKIAMSVPSFAKLEAELSKPLNIIEELMVGLLDRELGRCGVEYVGFSVPFPGNLLSALRCAGYIKGKYPGVKTIIGGGYPSTELRSMTDKGIFDYIDYCILDDGELPLERILSGGELVRTYTRDGYFTADDNITHLQRGCPDFSGLPHRKYISLTEVTNPMHRLWSDGRWNKMMIAHGCYWAKCAFCDTSLDYICRYDTVPAAEFVDWMERVMAQTGSRGFHFVDEAAPPKMLKEISLEILRRGLKVAWWTNIRFESSFTGDLAMLMAAAGCVAVSGGLETASDRLLEKMNKGVTIEQATMVMRGFYYSGIMVHAYLMYGFPGQTLQESVDSLEVVRQMFRAELINSAFWHRYAMTLHSPCGLNPEVFGAVRRSAGLSPFANNEVEFTDKRDHNINMVGEALRESLCGYMYGNGIDRPAHKWFKGKDVPQTTVENSLITDHLIKPDNGRIYDPAARLLWIGVMPEKSHDGITLRNAAGFKSVKFTEEQSAFVMRIMELASDLSRKMDFAEAARIYSEYSEEPFVVFFLSKKWDVMRTYGLLKI